MLEWSLYVQQGWVSPQEGRFQGPWMVWMVLLLPSSCPELLLKASPFYKCHIWTLFAWVGLEGGLHFVDIVNSPALTFTAQCVLCQFSNLVCHLKYLKYEAFFVAIELHCSLRFCTNSRTKPAAHRKGRSQSLKSANRRKT